MQWLDDYQSTLNLKYQITPTSSRTKELRVLKRRNLQMKSPVDDSVAMISQIKTNYCNY